jgi:predicted DNA-binding transcriptional regulator AlpA
MRLLTFTELQRQKGIPYCRDHLRRLVKAGHFPQPIELGARRIAWAEDEVDAHLDQLVAKRNAAPEPQLDNKEEKPPLRDRGGSRRTRQ